jgi:hypothetical protein
MSGIPLHIQRRFKQRWAARFVPVMAAAPKNTALKRPLNPKGTRVAASDRRNRFPAPTKPA